MLLPLLVAALACGGTESAGVDGVPTVSTTAPARGATAVALDSSLRATFSAALDPATVNSSTFLLAQGAAAVSGTVTVEGSTAIFQPSAPLAASLPFTATLTTGVHDSAGHALAAAYSWEFSTAAPGDTTAPTVVLVGGDGDVTATFSEALAPASVDARTFTVTAPGAAAVAGTVRYTGLVATFHPDAPFADATLVTATLHGGTSGVTDLAGVPLAKDFVWSFTTGARPPQQPVFLGGAAAYVILAESAISTVPSSAITGDIALSPAAASYITGFSLTEATGYATSTQVVGKVYAADYVTPTSGTLTVAVNDMGTAYVDAAGRPSPDFLELGTGAIGGLVMAPGLYKWSGSVTIGSDVVLDGSDTDVWIFQVAGDLSQSAGKAVTLRGGALAKNVFWQVAGAVELGTTSHFEGILLCQTAVAMRTGASFHGRALAQTAVTLESNAITQP